VDNPIERFVEQVCHPAPPAEPAPATEFTLAAFVAFGQALLDRAAYTQTPHEARLAEVARIKADLWLSSRPPTRKSSGN
jgi:hypothetical protein